MKDKEPRDKNGTIIGIGDILIAQGVDNAVLRFEVLDVDHLLGSGAVKLKCLFPVEPGRERREVSRSELWRAFEIEKGS